MQRRLGPSDIGCYADAAGGWGRVRARLADFLELNYPVGDAADRLERRRLSYQLRHRWSDDRWEEDRALEILNSIMVEEGEVYFEFDGGLMLRPDITEEE
jgi:hypothetical protein